MSEPLPLHGRRVAVTGGGRGIGYAIVKQALEHGAAVAFCSRSLDAAEAAAAALRESVPGAVVYGFAADVTDAAAIAAFARDAGERLGGIDSLVCNAGIWGPKGSIDHVDFDEWLHAFDVNVHGVVRTLRAFLPALRAAESPRVVVMAGGGAYQPYPYLSAYGATKSAIARWGESVAHELEPEGITLNLMLPGPVNTGMVDELLAAGPELLGEKRYAKVVAQKRGGGTPPERGAALCSYLLSDRIAGITGKLISVADAWQTLHERRDAIVASDDYTLRRVVP